MREHERPPLDPEDCSHPGRPPQPREDAKAWHCEVCDTSFVPVTELVWREL